MEKPFFRESNIWRLIAFLICFVGLFLAIMYPEILVYENHGAKISLGVLVLIFGMLGFYPTLKEAFAKRIKK